MYEAILPGGFERVINEVLTGRWTYSLKFR
jgi:hypothetical protein